MTGESKLREAAKTHVAGIHADSSASASRRTSVKALGGLLERLPLDPAEDLSCGPLRKTSQRAHESFFRALNGPGVAARLPLAPSTERE